MKIYPKFIIYAPSFNFGSGGTKVLHKLCHILNTCGYVSYLYPDTILDQHASSRDEYCVNSEYNTPIIPSDLITNQKNLDEYVIVYPEVYLGNPLNAKNVVRWILNHPCGRETTYGNTDLFFYYSNLFFHPKLKDEGNILTIYEFHSNIFNDLNIERTNSCFTIRKCHSPKFIHPENSIEIQNTNSLSQIAHIFNATKAFYSYDDITFLSVQAAMCGCLSIVVPWRYNECEWRNKTPNIYHYGIAYGNSPEQIHHAISTHATLNVEIKKIKDDYTEVNRFVSKCRARFYNIIN